jgi:MbtH protein
MSDEREDTTIYLAVVSDDEQYSIWPEDRELPPGWREAGKRGPRAEVMAWIEEVWADMQRPGLRMRRDSGSEPEQG